MISFRWFLGARSSLARLPHYSIIILRTDTGNRINQGDPQHQLSTAASLKIRSSNWRRAGPPPKRTNELETKIAIHAPCVLGITKKQQKRAKPIRDHYQSTETATYRKHATGGLAAVNEMRSTLCLHPRSLTTSGFQKVTVEQSCVYSG